MKKKSTQPSVSGSSGRYLVLAINLVSALFRDVVRGAAAFAREAGWTIVFADEGDLSKALERYSPVGAIVSDGSQQTLQSLKRYGTIGVCVSQAHHFDGITRVVCDDVEMGAVAAQFFLQRGYRQCGCIGRPDRLFAWLRCKGFAETVRAAGAHCSELPLLAEWPAGWTHERIDLPAVTDWLSRQPLPFAVYHAVADIQVICACRELGLRIPEDIALIAGDDDDVKCYASPVPLASVRIAGRRIGYIAAELISRRKDAGSAEIELIKIPPVGVINRQSADYFAIEDAAVRSAADYIQRQAYRPLQVSDIVERSGVSRRVLERRFRQVLGRTVGQDIGRAHLALAMRQLADTELAIEQVAAVSGYTSAVYMASVFRRELGVSPSEYRRNFAA